MSQLPETINGYDAPHSTQFSVFLDNRVGKMYELLKIFDGVKLRMVALNVIDSSDHAVVRLITSNSTLAHKLLVENKNAFSECPILLVEFGQGLTLAKLCMTLLSAEISIHYAYSLLIRPHNTAVIALHTDDQYLAGKILQRKDFVLLGEADLCGGGLDDTSDFDSYDLEAG